MKTLIDTWRAFRRRFTRSIEVLGYLDGARGFPSEADGIAVPLYGTAPAPQLAAANNTAEADAAETNQPKGATQ